MGTQSYCEWNSYFLDVFFFKSAPDSLIRFKVSEEWFESIPARQGMGGYLDFMEAVKEASKLRSVYDSLCDMLEQQRRCPLSPPAYVAYLVFLCLPWTWAQDSNNARNYCARNYWERLQSLAKDFGIDCGRLTDTNYHFSRLLGGNSDLLSLLRDWSLNNKPRVQGEFVYCHLYDDADDKVSLLRSQVWPTESDLKWMPEILFSRTDQSDELDEQQLFDFCCQERNLGQAWASFRNLFLSSDSIAQKVKRDALEQIYEEYEEWVNNGRPPPLKKVVHETRQSTGRGGEDNKDVTYSESHIWLRLKQRNGHWERSLFLRSSDFPSEAVDSEMEGLIEVGGHQWNCPLTRLPSGNFLIKEQDEVWNALADVEPQADLPSKMCPVGDFIFSPRKCYVMLPSSSGTLLQQDFASPEQEFWALSSANNIKFLTDWIEVGKVQADPPVDIGGGWVLQRIHGLDDNQRRLFPNGLDNKGQKGLLTRLTGGLKARMGALFRRRYLREFLPSIEAYLPDAYTVLVRNEYGQAYDPVTVLHEVFDEEEEVGAESIRQKGSNSYLDRTFSISLPPGFIGSEIRFQFRINGQDYGPERQVKLAPSGTELDVRSFHAWDCFGNVVPRENGIPYWPDTNELKPEVSFDLPSLKWPLRNLDVHQKYWDFIGQLSKTQGSNGIPGKEFWAIVCANFHYVSEWKQQVQFLSQLGILDIQTNDFGLWSKFFLNDPTLCLLPSKDSEGRVQAILTGAFGRHHVEELRTDAGLLVEIGEQRYQDEQPLPILPPRVLVRTASVEAIKFVADQHKLAWGGIPALGFARQSATLEEWLCDRNRYGRDGKPRDEDITGWYDFLGYKMQKRNAEGKLSNPLSSCPTLFARCMSLHPCPSIRNLEVFDLVNRINQDGYTSVYIKDIPWGRWVSYLLEARFHDLRFRIAYQPDTGTMVFPEELAPPKVLARALTLCSGRIPQKVDDPSPYDLPRSPRDVSTPYGLAMNPYKGACLRFSGVPREIAESVAQKLHAELKDY